MKLFTTRKIAEIDRYTIENEPIMDIDLMERASMAIADRIVRLTGGPRNLIFLAGPGNNGGDALAVARLMSDAGYPCEVCIPAFGKSSPSQQTNLQRLRAQAKAKICTISGETDFPCPEPGSIIIDGLYGSGLTRPLDGLAAALVRHVNKMVAENRVSGSRYRASGIGYQVSRQKDPRQKDSEEIRNHKSEIRNQSISEITPPIAIGAPSEIPIEPHKAQKDTEVKTPSWHSDFAVKSEIKVISIDIPSGLMGEDNSGNIPENIIRADATITLQFPKLSLLFPENEPYAGKVFIEDIGLHPAAIHQTESPFFTIDRETVYPWFVPRSRVAHKGDFGHALLIAGSYGKMGAAVMASEACLKTGAGLVTTHLPSCGCVIQQTYCPEVMCSIDPGQQYIMDIPTLKPYLAIAIGPGLGSRPETQKAISVLLGRVEVPVVWDADALNCLSLNPVWLKNLPKGGILTPHPGEFRRLFGETDNSWQRLQLLRSKAMELQVVIVLKGAHTAIALPDGNVWFNTTGNPGMATGGSGDVLTGIILGLLAQGFTPEHAAIAGVFIHGEAGDAAAGNYSELSMTATDITAALPLVFKRIFASRESDF